MTKAKNTFKRSTSFILAIITIMTMLTSVFAISASAASIPFHTTKETQTGCITGSYGTPCEVYTTGQAAKLRICTFNQDGKRTSGKITVKAVSDNGGVWTWNVTGCNGLFSTTTNITLPKGNTHYMIYIRRNGNSNANKTNTYYCSIDFMKNCARQW